MSLQAQEAFLDQQEEKLDAAYESSALSEHEYKRMIAQLDRERRALYAREDDEQ